MGLWDILDFSEPVDDGSRRIKFDKHSWGKLQRFAVVRGDDEMDTLAHAIVLEQNFCEKVILGGGRMEINMPDGTKWNFKKPSEM